MQPFLNDLSIIGIIATVTGTAFAIAYFAFDKNRTPGEVAKILSLTAGIVVLVIVIGIGILNVSSTGRGITATATPVSTSTTTDTSISNTGSTSASTGLASLTPQEVQSWCYTLPNGGTCNISRFVQFRRANKTALTYAVQMLPGEPVGIKLPAGFTAEIWDCSQDKIVSGAIDLTNVCTMKVARGTQIPD